MPRLSEEEWIKRIKKDYKVLDKVKHQTEAMCLAAIEKNWRAIGYVKEQTPEICELALKKDVQALGMIRNPTVEMFEFCLEQDPRSMRYALSGVIPESIILQALEKMPEVISYVWRNDITDLIIDRMIEWSPERIVKCVRYERFTESMKKRLLERYGLFLEQMPVEERNEEACRLAVAQNGLVLKQVPKEVLTPDLCQLAVVQNGLALKFVPKKWRTPELEGLALKQNPSAVFLLDSPSEEMIWEALKTDVKWIRKIKQPTEEMWCFVLERNGELLKYCKTINPLFCQIAVKQTPKAMAFVPVEFKTEYLWWLCAKEGKFLSEICEDSHLMGIHRIRLEVMKHFKSQLLPQLGSKFQDFLEEEQLELVLNEPFILDDVELNSIPFQMALRNGYAMSSFKARRLTSEEKKLVDKIGMSWEEEYEAIPRGTIQWKPTLSEEKMIELLAEEPKRIVESMIAKELPKNVASYVLHQNPLHLKYIVPASKDYRLCRFALRLKQEAKLFSPYDV